MHVFQLHKMVVWVQQDVVGMQQNILQMQKDLLATSKQIAAGYSLLANRLLRHADTEAEGTSRGEGDDLVPGAY